MVRIKNRPLNTANPSTTAATPNETISVLYHWRSTSVRLVTRRMAVTLPAA